MKQLPPDVVAAAQNNALWNKEEESLLANIPSVGLILTSTVTVTFNVGEITYFLSLI